MSKVSLLLIFIDFWLIYVQKKKKKKVVALEILKAFSDNIASLPSNVQLILNQIGQAVESKFADVKADGKKHACVFLFLHVHTKKQTNKQTNKQKHSFIHSFLLQVITPMIVSPSTAGLCKDVIKDRDVLLALAKIGRVIQKWVNSALGAGDEEEYMPRSVSEMSLSSIASDDGSSATSSRSDQSDHPTPRNNMATPRNTGEAEVLKFVDLLFKTDGPPPPVRKPDADEVYSCYLNLKYFFIFFIFSDF